MTSIACIGAAHVDIRARALGPVALGSSNPVTPRRGVGGVARNVATGLALLGHDVRLISRIGMDSEGDRVLAALAAAGVDAEGVTRSTDQPTATYTALVGPDGEMVVALADMAIYDEMTPALIAPALADVTDRRLWMVDANLPVDTLDAIADARPESGRLAADAVSVAKAPRLLGVLDRLAVLVCNADEAAALTGRPVRHPLEVCEAAATLRGAGVGTVVIGLGARGAYVASAGAERFLPAAPATMVDTTGAGDALVAGLLHAIAGGGDGIAALAAGLAAAALTVESEATVPESLTPGALADRAERLSEANLVLDA
ncbi:MAG: carbohydrate kinase family protein [Azospirillaceae bacterium]